MLADLACRVPWRHILIPCVAIALAALLNSALLLNAYVPSGSMEPTISPGSMVLGNRLSYTASAPQAGDIVFFRHAETGAGRWLVKRVVAVPGQTFAMSGGRVYVDGELLDEPYVEAFSDDDYPDTLVPDGNYVVLGDNRRKSRDSRFWSNPFVGREDVGAKGMFVYFPKFKEL